MKQRNDIARYELIAVDIARKIISGEYSEGYKIRGTSSLSSLYKASPETIRKGIAVLADEGVVEVVPGSSARVLSSEAANHFLEVRHWERIRAEKLDRLTKLMTERKCLEREIEQLINDIVRLVEHQTSRTSSNYRGPQLK